MRRLTAIRLAAAVVVGALALAGCGDDGGGGGAGTATSTTKQLKVGLAYDVGGRGDKSFNDAAARGLDEAESKLKVQTRELSASLGESNAQKESRLKLLAQAGFDPIIAVGFVYAPALANVVKLYPKTHFAIVDSEDVKGTNVTNLVFAEEQGSFLVGVAAALKSKTKNVGYIGGVQTPLLQKFEAGYRAGVAAVDKSIKVQVKYLTQPPDFSGFNDPAKGKTAANGMYDGGADIVFAAAGGSGTGAFQAAREKNKRAIGVDSDQYLTAAANLRPVIMTSMLKRVDVAVFDYIENASKGTYRAGPERFTLADDGVGYATSGGQVDDIKGKLDDYRKQIIDGKIQVPTTPPAS